MTSLVDRGLTAYGINPVVHSLIIDGVFAGVGSVLSFLPIIVTLFFFLSILEDSGYMARVAFVMDKLLRKIGLSGRSFVPMLIGFGCSVPAIMATRTLSSDRDRKMTILLTPFMSCSAKLPIYAVFTAAFFPQNGALVMILLYVMGMVIGVLIGLLMKNTMYRGNPVPFVMELPNYRLPSPKSVGLLLWDKAKDFLTRAFTVIFVATIIIWFLQSFDIRLNVVADSSASMLAGIGRVIAPVFAPLGFTDWRASTALITGFSAKEAVVSTMAVLTGTTVSHPGRGTGRHFLAAGSVQLFDVHAAVLALCGGHRRSQTGNALRLGRGVRGAVPVCGGLGVRLPGVPDWQPVPPLMHVSPFQQKGILGWIFSIGRCLRWWRWPLGWRCTKPSTTNAGERSCGGNCSACGAACSRRK